MSNEPDEERGEPIDINEIKLYSEMSEKIVGLLKVRNNDMVSMYAAKLIESLQARLNYIRNGNCKVFIPPANSHNIGED